jgi:hypothetical protein
MSSEELAAILSALQSGDESATFSALADLTPGLAMGTEETLQNFDANEFASVLVVLLSTMLHNPDILLLTCRAVCHILEALPRSSVLFVRHGVLAPLCEQLRSIQFIDVAEQCMVALHKLSQFFAQPMLAADALGAVLGFVDFFSSSTQRTALRTAAYLCAAVTEKDVANVLPSLPALVQLMRSTDVAVASSAVECVATLVLQCRRWPAQLERMVSSEPQVVAGLVRLVGGAHDESVARISPSARALAPPALAALATALPQSLLEMCQAGLPSLIHFALLADSGAHHHLSHVSSTSPSVSGSPLLVAGASPSTPVIGSSPLVRRSADDVLRLVVLADALLPALPAELAALFDADAPVSALPGVFGSAPIAIAAGDDGEGDDMGDDGAAEDDDNNRDDEQRDIFEDVAAEAMGTTTESAPQLLSAWLRRPPASAEASSAASTAVRDWAGEYARDGRVALFKEHGELVLAIGGELLNAVMQVYNGNADASLREKCAQFVVKLSYVANEVQLDSLIRELSFSSFVAALLASRRVTLCGAAVALARLAWEKLPFVLPVHYRREGVMSELRTLSERANDSDERWRRVAAAAGALLEQDLDAAGALNQSGGSDTLQAMCAALSALASATTTEAASGALDAVAAALLADARLSVHEFELSGVVGALLAFLEVDGAATIQRAAMLGAALCARNSADETAGMWLLRLLQQSLLKHADAFRVRRTGDVAGGVSQSVLLLSRALRVQLKPTDASNKTHFAARVMVEPLASIRAVAEFVGARFDESGEPREASASSSGARARAHSNSGGGGVNVSEFDIAAGVIGDGGDDDAGLRRSTGVGRSRVRIDVRLGSQRLDTNQTIIQALVAAVLAGGGDSESANLSPIWTQTHELTYDVVVDSDMLTASSGASDDGTRSPLLRSSTCISAPSEAGELEDFAVLAAAFSARIALPGAPAALTAALRLITVLRAMHEHPELCMSSDGLTELRVCPSAVEFENARFDATMAQQLGEPLLLAAGALPPWCRPLVSTPARIVSLATRALYFRATALGHGRLLAALEQRVGGIVVGGRSSSSNSSSSGSGGARAEGVQVTRLERAKVRVRRSTILECAYAVLSSECGTTRALLEVEFFDEQGTGSGPTLEFFTHAARELWSTTSWATPLLWRTNGDGSALLPLFPRIYADGVLPPRVERLFVFCGRLMARALLDDRRVDLPLALPLAARLAGSSRRYSHATALRVVDAAQALFLDRLERAAAHGDGLFDGAPIDALGLDFTLPGAAQVPLVPGGDGVPVTRDNAAQYVALVRDLTVGRGVAAQCEALVRGFRSVLDAPLDLFTPPELLDLLCGHDEPWSIESLRAAVRVDHGYSVLEQGPVAHLLRTLADFDANERRHFLMFATGAPRLPLGGLASTKLTVVKKELPLGIDADSVLPSVSVCAGSLKLPPYSSVAVTRRQLSYAMMNARAFTFN